MLKDEESQLSTYWLHALNTRKQTKLELPRVERISTDNRVNPLWLMDKLFLISFSPPRTFSLLISSLLSPHSID